MKDLLRYILISVISLLVSASCDIHEFPVEEGEPTPFELSLEFNFNLPLLQEITRDDTPDHEHRYTIQVFRSSLLKSMDRIPVANYVYMESELESSDYKIRMDLTEDTYDFRVWVDYTDINDKSDKYYNTENFSEIILADRNNHSGSNDYREVFIGNTTATVYNPEYYTGIIADKIDNSATIQMHRPQGKFQINSTDLKTFFSKHSGVSSLKGYTAVIRYTGYMPCSFNMFTDRPSDSWTGMSFTSEITELNDEEAILGFDYIFVNGGTTTMNIALEVYDPKGKMVASTNPLEVPVMRDRLTIVNGQFLTSHASGGIYINTDFEGNDYNIEIL